MYEYEAGLSELIENIIFPWRYGEELPDDEGVDEKSELLETR